MCINNITSWIKLLHVDLVVYHHKGANYTVYMIIHSIATNSYWVNLSLNKWYKTHKLLQYYVELYSIISVFIISLTPFSSITGILKLQV